MLKHTNNVPIGYKQRVVPMDQYSTTKWGIIPGIIGGMWSWFMQSGNILIQSTNLENLLQLALKVAIAGATALVCGVAGAAGKHLYDICKPKINQFLKRKK